MSEGVNAGGSERAVEIPIYDIFGASRGMKMEIWTGWEYGRVKKSGPSGMVQSQLVGKNKSFTGIKPYARSE